MVKPSLTFHRINVHVNRNRKQYRRISHNRSNDKQRHESRKSASTSTDGNSIKTNDNTKYSKHKRKIKTTQTSSKEIQDIATNNQKSKNKESKEVRKPGSKEDIAKDKPHSTTGNDIDSEFNSKSKGKNSGDIINKGSTDLGPENTVDVKITNNDQNSKKKSDTTKQELRGKEKTKSIYKDAKNERAATDIQKTDEKLDEKQLNGSKIVIDESKISTAQLKKINPIRDSDLKLTDKSKGIETNKYVSDKTIKDTDKDNKNKDQEKEIKNDKNKSKVLSEPNHDLSKSPKRRRKGKKKAKEKETKNDIVIDDKKSSLHISTEKPNDEKNAVDHVLPKKLKDRWSRKGLSQVPDVERLVSLILCTNVLQCLYFIVCILFEVLISLISFNDLMTFVILLNTK